MNLLELLGIAEPEENTGNIISLRKYKAFNRKDTDELLGEILENAYNELKGGNQFVMERLWNESGVMRSDGEPDMRAFMRYVCALYDNYDIDIIKTFFDNLIKNKLIDAEDKFLYGLNLFELRIIILLSELFISMNLSGYFYAYRKFDYIYNELLADSYDRDITEFKAAMNEYKENKDNHSYPHSKAYNAIAKLNDSHNLRLNKMTEEIAAMKKRLNKACCLSILNMITNDFMAWRDSYANYAPRS